MRLFVLARRECDWEETRSVAILAADEAEARRVASENFGEGSYAADWLDPAKVVSTEHDTAAAGIVLTDDSGA